VGFRDAMLETKAMGFDAAKAAQWELGHQVRALLTARGVAMRCGTRYRIEAGVTEYYEGHAS
jgi:aspartate aminotransferase-like enzyme